MFCCDVGRLELRVVPLYTNFPLMHFQRFLNPFKINKLTLSFLSGNVLLERFEENSTCRVPIRTRNGAAVHIFSSFTQPKSHFIHYFDVKL